MTGGGAIWSIVAASAAGLAAQAAAAAADIPDDSDGPYRPASWQNAPLVTITVPAGNTQSFTDTGDAASQVGQSGTVFSVNSSEQQTSTPNPPQVLVFDAVIRTEHQQRIEKTQQPIQTGANVSDHAFIQPARVVLEIGMSDAMDSYTPGAWTGDSAKSVNAYQTLKSIARARAANGALTVTTRLDTYTNMLLTSISAPDTAETRFGLRATIVFEELLTGTVTTTPVSARSDLTGSTNLGTKSPLPVPTSITQQNETNQTTTVPDAGVLSSNPISDGS